MRRLAWRVVSVIVRARAAAIVLARAIAVRGAALTTRWVRIAGAAGGGRGRAGTLEEWRAVRRILVGVLGGVFVGVDAHLAGFRDGGVRFRERGNELVLVFGIGRALLGRRPIYGLATLRGRVTGRVRIRLATLFWRARC